MIKAKQVFFWASNLKGQGFHGDKATILYLTLKYYLLYVLFEKLHFLEIGLVNQKSDWIEQQNVQIQACHLQWTRP